MTHPKIDEPVLFFLDLETSGTDPTRDKILEMCVIVTDNTLQPIDRLDVIIYHEPESVAQSDWAKTHHQSLMSEVSCSTTSLSDATQLLDNLIQKHSKNQRIMLAGSSVYFDRAFLEIHMPSIMHRVHHRLLDVSSIMEMVRRFIPRVGRRQPRNSTTHRASVDILSSLRLLQYYRDTLFRSS